MASGVLLLCGDKNKSPTDSLSASLYSTRWTKTWLPRRASFLVSICNRRWSIWSFLLFSISFFSSFCLPCPLVVVVLSLSLSLYFSLTNLTNGSQHRCHLFTSSQMPDLFIFVSCLSYSAVLIVIFIWPSCSVRHGSQRAPTTSCYRHRPSGKKWNKIKTVPHTCVMLSWIPNKRTQTEKSTIKLIIKQSNSGHHTFHPIIKL